METVSQDFEFDKQSHVYGKFLCTVYDAYPGAKITDVSSKYQIPKGSCVVNTDTPEDIAMMLKLSYGNYMRQRPREMSAEEITKLYETMLGYMEESSNKKAIKDWHEKKDMFTKSKKGWLDFE